VLLRLTLLFSTSPETYCLVAQPESIASAPAPIRQSPPNRTLWAIDPPSFFGARRRGLRRARAGVERPIVPR
jgi:hypothetical protein